MICTIYLLESRTRELKLYKSLWYFFIVMFDGPYYDCFLFASDHTYIDSAILRNNNAYRWIGEPEPFLVVETVSVAAYIRSSQTLIPLIAHGHGGVKRVENLFPGPPPPPIQLSQSLQYLEPNVLQNPSPFPV